MSRLFILFTLIYSMTGLIGAELHDKMQGTWKLDFEASKVHLLEAAESDEQRQQLEQMLPMMEAMMSSMTATIDATTISVSIPGQEAENKAYTVVSEADGVFTGETQNEGSDTKDTFTATFDGDDSMIIGEENDKMVFTRVKE